MNNSELIELFLTWSKQEANLRKSYKSIFKKKNLLNWDSTYFKNQLFMVDEKDIDNSIKKIKELIYTNKDPEWIRINKSTMNGAPQAILGDENYLKFLKEKFMSKPNNTNEVIVKKEISGDENNILTNRNYFVFWTKEASIVDLTKQDSTKKFWFTGNYKRFKETQIGDIGFFVQKGELSKINWPRGLSAIYKIIDIRKDLGGRTTSQNTEYFDVLLEPILKLPEVLDKSAFKDYKNTHEIVHIARENLKDPDQTNWLIPITLAQNLVGALIDIFPSKKEDFQNIFGSNFATEVKIVEKGNLSITNYDDIQGKLEPNEIKGEPRNLIVYGAPGTGKSYKLKIKVEGSAKGIIGLFPHEWLRTRITFHPNYSYRNFVGSYKPMPLYKDSKEKIYSSDAVTENRQHQKEPFIEYQFEPGPFLEMFVRAINNPNYNFVIIIEEINRANTAAVFGDVFQLLDRNEIGESEYSITLEPSAQDYLKANNVITPSIKIPSNLYLWATMNSADQGVMPLDSAFKRRWSFEHLGLNENEADIDDLYISIPFLAKNGEKLKWNEFRSRVNDNLLNEGIHEDKLIGPFFLNKTEISNHTSVKNKLLLYLKEDVLRYKPSLFNDDLRSFSQISEAFEKGHNIFSRDIEFKTELIQNNEIESEQTDVKETELEKTETQIIDAQ